ncbi:MAG: hypothetical protein KDB60_00880 [Propionibacteriaceae bacterium]|nr:hypothetical protein [Propionibacteriaceae bacterium]
MPSPTRVVDWRAAADPDDLREYDRFGPWIDRVGALVDMPRRFRPWYSELSAATHLIKVPRNIDRAQARPGMDLYTVVLALFPDWLCMLRLDVGGVTRTDLPLEHVVATNVHSNLLIGRWSLLLADGTSLDLEYNTVSERRVAELDRYLRRRPAPDEPPVSLLPSVRVSDHYFTSLLAHRAAVTDEPVHPVHVEERGRACRDERLRRRVSTGLMLLETPTELVVVNRGAASRSRFRWANYASNVLTIPYGAMTSFSVVAPTDDPPGQFHRLVIGCDRHVVSQPCLVRPDAVATLLAARGVRPA